MTKPAYKLLLASALALLFQLAFVRFLPSRLSFLGFYNHYILLASLFGFGLGFLLKSHLKKLNLLFLFSTPFIFASYIFLCQKVGPRVIGSEGSNYLHLTTDYLITEFLPIWAVILIVLTITILYHVPLGAHVAGYFKHLKSLKAYTINILGSLLGIMAFYLLAYLQQGPITWFALCLFLVVYLQLPDRRLTFFAVCVSLLTLSFFIGEATNVNIHWSQYAKITVEEPPENQPGKPYAINVNDIFFMMSNNDHIEKQSLFAPGGETRLLDSLPENWRNQVTALTQKLKAQVNNGSKVSVAMLGTGAGSWVSYFHTLLSPHVEIDAVELDPKIIELSAKLNKLNPYEQKNVRVYNEDARSFITNSKKQYDIITMIGVDSILTTAARGNVRLDSFLYTTEAFTSIYKRLKPNGIFILAYGIPYSFIFERFQAMLERSFFQPPKILKINMGPIQGRAFISKKTSSTVKPNKPGIELATDDWPFFFLKDARIPPAYLLISAFFLLVVIISAYTFYRSKSGLTSPSARLTFFFCLGAAFMLLEISALSRFMILFSVSWYVKVVVIATIMIFILLGNLLAAKTQKIPLVAVFSLLFAALALNFYFPLDNFIGSPAYFKIFLSALILGPAFLLSAFLFAIIFRQLKQGENAEALAFNLFGTVAGGLLESLSMIWGFRFLLLPALMLYGMAYICYKRQPTISLPRSE